VGTMFSVTVTYGQAQALAPVREEDPTGRDLEGLCVLCMDNDALILDGMEKLLTTMGAKVLTATNREQLIACFNSTPGGRPPEGRTPDIVLADYHLDDRDTGLHAMQEARKLGAGDTPCIIISADDSDVIRDRAKAVGYRFLPKPVNAARLRALVLALTR
jgi:CheY-like chemotaxis protein